jgi:hypothetical protein
MKKLPTGTGSKLSLKVPHRTVDSVHSAVTRWTLTVSAWAFQRWKMEKLAEVRLAPCGIEDRSKRRIARFKGPDEVGPAYR